MADLTLVIIKPDAVERGLTGEILARFERKGLRIAALKLMTMDPALAEQHYAEHEGKPFFEPLVAFMSSGPVVAAIFEGERCVEGFRALAGATDPTKAAPGSIRGDFATQIGENIVHGSDSEESAARELALFFG